MKVQIASDLHTEMGPVNLIPSDAEVLILAGDIGKPFESSYLNLVGKASREFEKVLIVTGNHEYYSSGKKKHEIDHQVWNLSMTLPNVVPLLTSSFEYKGWLFLGTTLWTNVSPSYHITSSISDYSHIKVSAPGSKYGWEKLTPQKVKEWHQHELGWLSKQVRENPDSKICVITHHAPSFKSCIKTDPIYQLLNEAYATDLENFLLENPQIKMWVHGHTHSRLDYYIGGCRIVCNPGGYPDELEYATKVIELN